MKDTKIALCFSCTNYKKKGVCPNIRCSKCIVDCDPDPLCIEVEHCRGSRTEEFWFNCSCFMSKTGWDT